MPDRERKRVPDHSSDVLKGSHPEGPYSHPRNTKDASTQGRVKRVRRRVEMKQLRAVWRSCARDNVEAGESCLVLNRTTGS